MPSRALGRFRICCQQWYWRLADLDGAVAHREHQGLRARMHPELGEDVHHVDALRADGYAEQPRDLLAIKTSGKRLQHLSFAHGELLDGQLCLPILLTLMVGETEEAHDLVW